MIDAEVKPFPLITAAIRSGDLAELILLFKRFPEMVPFRVPGFETWLHHAAAHGTLEIVDHLVSMGFDVNAREAFDGLVPLNMASHEGQYEIALYLLDRGSVMDVGASVRNPLFGAIVGGSPRIARLLLDRGIDAAVRYTSPTMTDMDATAFAIERGESEIAEMIAAHNAGGDPEKARELLVEAERVSRSNDRYADDPSQTKG